MFTWEEITALQQLGSARIFVEQINLIPSFTTDYQGS